MVFKISLNICRTLFAWGLVHNLRKTALLSFNKSTIILFIAVFNYKLHF